MGSRVDLDRIRKIGFYSQPGYSRVHRTRLMMTEWWSLLGVAISRSRHGQEIIMKDRTGRVTTLPKELWTQALAAFTNLYVPHNLHILYILHIDMCRLWSDLGPKKRKRNMSSTVRALDANEENGSTNHFRLTWELTIPNTHNLQSSCIYGAYSSHTWDQNMHQEKKNWLW